MGDRGSVVDGIVDASAFVGAWPFRALPLAEPGALRDRLRANGVVRAYVSPVECVLQRTPRVINRVWGERLAGDDFFEFVPVANPGRARAVEVLDEWPDARAVRILPGPHGYLPTAATDFAATAGKRGRTVIVQWRMVDARMAHPDLAHREPTVEEVLALVRACPDTRFVLAGVRMTEIAALLAEGGANLWCELSHAEAPNLVRRLISTVGADRLLCGTHAPVHVVEALPAKLAAADLTAAEAAALTYRNAVAAGLVDEPA